MAIQAEPRVPSAGGLDADNVVVAGMQRLWVAPTGTALPASIDVAPAAAWFDLGYTTEDGIAVSFGKDTDDLMTSQSLDPVRKLVTGAPKTITAALRQINEVTLPLALGGGEIDGDDDDWTFTPAPASFIDERSLIVEAEDGETKLRVCYSRVMVSEAVETTFVNTAGASLPLTFSVLSADPPYIIQGAGEGFMKATTPSRSGGPADDLAVTG